jgi:hypothetical protein
MIVFVDASSEEAGPGKAQSSDPLGGPFLFG